MLAYCVVALLAMVQAGAPPDQAALTRTLADSRTLIAEGKAREAIAKLEALGNAERESAAAAHLLGVAYYHADEHERAIRQLGAVRDAFPDGSSERREAIQILGLCVLRDRPLRGRRAAARADA